MVFEWFESDHLWLHRRGSTLLVAMQNSAAQVMEWSDDAKFPVEAVMATTAWDSTGSSHPSKHEIVSRQGVLTEECARPRLHIAALRQL